MGINNSGKSALLEAISLNFANIAHRDSKEGSTVKHTFRIASGDILRIIKKHDSFEMPTYSSPEIAQNMLREGLDQFLDVTVTSNPKQFSYEFVYRSPSGNYTIDGSQIRDTIRFSKFDGHSPIAHEVKPRAGLETDLETEIRDFIKNFFFFKGERTNLHTHKIGRSSKLASDASNLPQVLNTVINSQVTFQNYLNLIRRVLPEVKYVSSELADGEADFSIKIRTSDATLEEEEMRFPLEDCGTGVGQVLAILYVIATSKKPSVIAVDEPTSFLHPSATRELIRIFKEYPQHQYFISTHSAEVFAEVRPKTYTRLSYQNGRTAIMSTEIEQIGETYRELGISPFYEFTYWVEGETELLAFPYILGDTSVQIHTFSVSDVITRKDSKREIDRLLEIHGNMLKSRSGEPTKPKMKIVVDREHLNEQNKADYEKRPDKMVNFLPRKMFENYLLHGDAIAVVINQHLKEPITKAEIDGDLESFRNGVEMKEWLATANGAKILEELFSLHLCEFVKTKHGVEITKWLMDNDPRFLHELKMFLLNLREETTVK